MTTIMPKENPLVWMFSDLFILAGAIRTASSCGDPEKLHIRLRELLHRAQLEAERRGVSLGDIQNAIFAVVALLDENILNSPWPKRDEWTSRMLQAELFNTHEAGVEFFERLDRIRRTLPANTDVLELYYLCLTLGFEGKYAVLERSRRSTLVEEIARDLNLMHGGPCELSPNGVRPHDVPFQKPGTRLPWIIIGTAVVMIIILYVFLGWRMEKEVSRVVSAVTIVPKEQVKGFER